MTTTRDPAPAEIEREPLCEVAYCPAPTDPDWHVCLVDGSTTIEHHHVEGRGKTRTMDSTKVVPLSVAIHKRISLNDWGDKIFTMPDGSKLYRIWDLHNETIHESRPWWMQPKEVMPSGLQPIPRNIDQRVEEGEEAGRGSSAVEEQQNSEKPAGSTVADNSTAVLPAGAVPAEDNLREGTAAPAGAGAPVESAAEEAVAGEEPAAEVGPSSAALPAGVEAGKQAKSVGPSSVEPARNLDSPAPAGPLAEDWRDLTDDELQAKYDAADAMQGMAFLIKCKAVHAFRENHVQVWRESWADHAIERFNVSRRTCARYANIWEIRAVCGTSLDIAPLTDSRSLMAFIGQKAVPAGVVAMEVAVAHHAEYAEPPTVAALAHRLGEEREAQPEPIGCCPKCGHESALSQFRKEA